MIIYTALTPYPPYVPGKKPEEVFDVTQKSLEAIEEELYALAPDTVIIIGKHDESIDQSHVIGSYDQFTTSFESYGDFETTFKIKGDLQLGQTLKEQLSSKHPLRLSSTQKLSFGISFVAHQLLNRLKKVAILPIYTSTQSLITHYDFGKNIRECCEESQKRIAVIAVGNMSHCLTKESPFRYNPISKKIDEHIINALELQDPTRITTLDTKTLLKAKECVTPQISILLGVIDGNAYATNILSYEHPHGVGYLTVTFTPLRHGI